MTEPTITVEEHARRVLTRELNRPVVRHDDGSAPGLYDLRVGTATQPDIAIECVGAVDPVRVETWNIGPARGPFSSALRGDWVVTLKPHAKVRPIRDQIEGALRSCEAAALGDFAPVDWRLKKEHPEVYLALSGLEVASVSCFRQQGTGEIHLGMTGIGGWVDHSGTAVPGWLSEFLSAEERADVLSKLLSSEAAERHVFVVVDFGGVPWNVESYLGTWTETLPTTEPALPEPVTAAWIMYGARGLNWDGSRWRFFDATVPNDGSAA